MPPFTDLTKHYYRTDGILLHKIYWEGGNLVGVIGGDRRGNGDGRSGERCRRWWCLWGGGRRRRWRVLRWRRQQQQEQKQSSLTPHNAEEDSRDWDSFGSLWIFAWRIRWVMFHAVSGCCVCGPFFLFFFWRLWFNNFNSNSQGGCSLLHGIKGEQEGLAMPSVCVSFRARKHNPKPFVL